MTQAASAQAPSAAQRSNRIMREDYARCVGRPEAIPATATSLIEACDLALSDPPGEQIAWQRQAFLLHAKAVWQYTDGRIPAAIATLDQSDAAAVGQQSIVHDIGIGLANTMLRALLYHRSNRSDQALALLESARAVRPYSLVVQRSIDRYELHIRGNANHLRSTFERYLATDPTAIVPSFYQQFFSGDLAAASVTAELARFDRPALIGGWTLDEDPALKNLTDQINMLYTLAYIRAAQDGDDAAEAVFTRIDRRLTAYVGPEPVPGPDGRAVRPADRREWQMRGLRANELRLPVSHWRSAIALRAALIGGADLSILDDRRYEAVRDLPAAADIMRVVAELNPDQRSEIETMLMESFNEGFREQIDLSPAQAIALLPHIETLSSYPRFGHADGVMVGRETGYSQAPQRDGDIRTIRFGTFTGTDETADELVMLAAATYAEREGFDSFLIVGRHLLQRRTTVSGYFTRTTENDSGSEAAVLAVLLDSTAIPPHWEAHRSRLIRVADVMASVGARQQVIEAAKAAESRRR